MKLELDNFVGDYSHGTRQACGYKTRATKLYIIVPLLTSPASTTNVRHDESQVNANMPQVFCAVGVKLEGVPVGCPLICGYIHTFIAWFNFRSLPLMTTIVHCITYCPSLDFHSCTGLSSGCN